MRGELYFLKCFCSSCLLKKKQCTKENKVMEEGAISLGFNPFSSVTFAKVRRTVSETSPRLTALPFETTPINE